MVTARAKGLSEWRLVMKYPVRLALNPLVSTIGWYLPQLFSGSLIVATVMNLPNIGPLLLARADKARTCIWPAASCSSTAH